MYLSYAEEETIRKLKLEIPHGHKYLSYVSKALDLIFFHDKPEAFQYFLEKHPHISTESTLKACIEYGAANCFKHFFDTTRSPGYIFEQLFKKPEAPSLGIQCAFYYIKNNKILNTMEEVCSTLFPGKTTLDFLTDKEQIEHCAARFGIKGRVKLAKKLLDKLDNPLYMVNNMPLFESIYANKADEFAKVYLNHLEEQQLIKPFLLSLFSKVNLSISSNQKYHNFFDRFTKEDNKDNRLHNILNDFLIKNIKNHTINNEFQELMMAYTLHNNNEEKFNSYNDARPITQQSLLLAIKEPWKYPEITDETYRYMRNSSNSEVFMTNNPFKKFHHNESMINQWYQTTRELKNPDMYSSVLSLFCLGSPIEMGKTIENLSNCINWNNIDKNGNNLAHYLVLFFDKMMKYHPNSSSAKGMFTSLSFLLEKHTDLLTTKNNDKVIPGEEFLKLVNNDSVYTKNLNENQKNDILKMEKTLNYALLNNELDHNNPTNTKRLKL